MRRRAQRAASGGVTGGIWVYGSAEKAAAPADEGRAEPLCGAKRRRGPSGGGRLYLWEILPNVGIGKQKSGTAAFNLSEPFRRRQNAAPYGILLPSHPRRTFCSPRTRARAASVRLSADTGSAARKAAVRLCAALPACPSAASPLTPAILRIAGARP